MENVTKKSAYDELRADLGERWSEVAGRIEQVEARVEMGLGGPGADPRDVRELLRYSRLMRSHMAAVESHAGELLDEIAAEEEGRGGAQGPVVRPAGEAERDAMLEIEREMHRPSRSMMEVIKAVFLWRDTPEERVERDEAPPKLEDEGGGGITRR